MAIIKQKDSRTGITYVYESISTWDKEKKQSRSKRVYLGPVDPATGEIIKGKRKAKQQARKIHEQTSEDVDNEVIKLLRGDVSDLQAEVSRLNRELEELKMKHNQMLRAVKVATSSLSTIPLD